MSGTEADPGGGAEGVHEVGCKRAERGGARQLRDVLPTTVGLFSRALKRGAVGVVESHVGGALVGLLSAFPATGDVESA